MSQVLNLFEKWSRLVSKESQPLPVPAKQPEFLTFEFVDESTSELSLLDFDASPTVSSSRSVSLGRTGACLQAHNLAAKTYYEEPAGSSASISYLQQDVRGAAQTDKASLFRKPAKPKNIQVTSLLDSSDILQMAKGRDQGYSLKRPETKVSKQLSLEVLRKLNQRESYEERLEKVRTICEKVSAEALSPLNRNATGPLRQMIQIKIG